MLQKRLSSLRIPQNEPGVPVAEAAKILSMPRATLYDRIRRKEIPSRKVSKRGTQIPLCVVRELSRWEIPEPEPETSPITYPPITGQAAKLPPLRELLND